MSVSSEIELICEEHPINKYTVRNGNIIALHKNSKFLISVLEKMKIKLINSKNAFGPKTVYDIGSKIYIDEFSYNKNACIYKYPFRNIIKSDANIYLKLKHSLVCYIGRHCPVFAFY